MTPTAINHLLELINTGAPASLGPEPRPDAQPLVALSRSLDERLARAEVTGERADLIRALLLLWHDHLDASHAISQGIESRDGSLVHGLMHRREPDYGNAKYWFRRAGQHFAYTPLFLGVSSVLSEQENSALRAQLLPRNRWDPCAFVDACAAAASWPATDPRVTVLRDLQRLEFESLLIHFCQAAGVR